MAVSRREFLGAATGVAASLTLVARARRLDASAADLATQPPLDCVLADLEDCCGLRESLAGYEAALHAAGVRFVRSAADPLPLASVVIVPGCARLESAAARRLVISVESGALLLLESGAGFADPADFTSHQSLLGCYFGLPVENPIDLWTDEATECRTARPSQALLDGGLGKRSRVPYVDYTWPVRAKVRDFSRAVPLATRGRTADRSATDVFGWVDDRPIAARRAVGKGTLVFLGSALGPALRTGDREAESWLRSLLDAA